MPDLVDGDLCRIQNQSGRFPKRWDKVGKIVEACGNHQYVVMVAGSGRLTLRNRKYLKKVSCSALPQVYDVPLSSKPAEEEDSFPTVNVKAPGFQDELCNPQVGHTPQADSPSNAMSEEIPFCDNTNEQAPAQDCYNKTVPETEHSSRSKRTRTTPKWHKDYIIGSCTGNKGK